MAVLHAFKALRPIPDIVQEVACVPYDVIDTSEARELAEGKPRSFLHVIRPEIDLENGIDEHADEVYRTGAANLRKFVSDGTLRQDQDRAVYIYRLIMNGRSQTGLFGCASVEDYDTDVILKHEKTRPDKEDDRTRHILEQSAHAEPVMLTFRPTDEINRLFARDTVAEPLYDFEASDGVQHTVWKSVNADTWVAAFHTIKHLYVADGHHRCKAASRAAADRLKAGDSPTSESQFFPAVFFPLDQMQILAYNRAVATVPQGIEPFLNEVRTVFGLVEGIQPVPEKAGSVCLYAKGVWYGVNLPETTRPDRASRLDVARLGEFILDPLLGIVNPRTDANIRFVGGIRGTSELERLVDTGKAELAISMFPTQPEELLEVSDAGQLMPPKSTWFEPKLRSGLLVHEFH